MTSALMSLPAGAFDLVHERAVLTFVPEREAALTRMVAALKPGGCLLVEELVAPVTEAAATDNRDSELAQQSRRAIVEVLRRRVAILSSRTELRA